MDHGVGPSPEGGVDILLRLGDRDARDLLRPNEQREVEAIVLVGDGDILDPRIIFDLGTLE